MTINSKATQSLHSALRQSKPPRASVVDAMIDAGADINAADANDGLTPLLRCLGCALTANADAHDSSAVRALVEKLLERGADLHALTPAGESAATLASRRDDDKEMTIILANEAYRRAHPTLAAEVRAIRPWWPQPGSTATAETAQEFTEACYHGNTEQIAYYLHLWPEALTWNDGDPLCWVVKGKYDDAHQAIALLLAKGVAIDAKNKVGETALWAAIARGNDAYIPVLISAGADENMPGPDDETPLELARDKNTTSLAVLEQAIAARTAKKESDIAAQKEAEIAAEAAARENQKNLNARLVADPRRKKFVLRGPA